MINGTKLLVSWYRYDHDGHMELVSSKIVEGHAAGHEWVDAAEEVIRLMQMDRSLYWKVEVLS